MRSLVFAALLAATSLPAAADPPTLATVLQQWRTAMHAEAAHGVAHAAYAVTEDGLAGTREQWASSDMRLHRVTDRRFDRNEVLATRAGAERKDWDGFVRSYNGREWQRQVTDTLNERALAFGPNEAFNAARIAQTDAGTTLTLTPRGGLPTTWLLDAQSHLPKSSTLDGITTDYSDWRLADGVMAPGTISVSAGSDDSGSTYTLTALVHERLGSAMFAPLRAGASDIALRDDAVRVPFTIEANHIVFSGRINGHGPIGLLLDTGDGEETINAARLVQFDLMARASSQAAEIALTPVSSLMSVLISAAPTSTISMRTCSILLGLNARGASKWAPSLATISSAASSLNSTTRTK